MVFLICILIYILGGIITWFTSLWCLYQYPEPVNGDDVKFTVIMSLLSWIGLISVLISFALASIKPFDWESLAKKVNEVFYNFYKGG